jgi:hypothetical protein
MQLRADAGPPGSAKANNSFEISNHGEKKLADYRIRQDTSMLYSRAACGLSRMKKLNCSGGVAVKPKSGSGTTRRLLWSIVTFKKVWKRGWESRNG